MNKYLLLTLLSIATSVLGDDRPAIVPGASYVISNSPNAMRGYSYEPGGKATFYTSDGTLIRTVDITPSAPKPQPVSSEVRYWPAIRVLFGTKGVPGDFIEFRDKHGNCIESYRYNQESHMVTTHYSREGNEQFQFPIDNPQTPKDFSLDLNNCNVFKILERPPLSPVLTAADVTKRVVVLGAIMTGIFLFIRGAYRKLMRKEPDPALPAEASCETVN
jgi:hypothetical protein